jgi:hypothetical protein
MLHFPIINRIRAFIEAFEMFVYTLCHWNTVIQVQTFSTHGKKTMCDISWNVRGLRVFVVTFLASYHCGFSLGEHLHPMISLKSLLLYDVFCLMHAFTFFHVQCMPYNIKPFVPIEQSVELKIGLECKLRVLTGICFCDQCWQYMASEFISRRGTHQVS